MVLISYFDIYKTRLNAYGGSISNSVKNNILQTINNSFEDSPFYRLVDINGIQVGCRVESTNEENKKKLLFKPDNTNKTGDIVTIDSDKWIIIDYINNGIIARGLIQKCNYLLKFYLSDNITLISTPAIVTNKISTGTDQDRYLILPEGKLEIVIQNNENNLTIKKGKRFIINDEAWKTSFVDKTTIPGLIKLTVEADVLKDSDDLVNGIADNSVPDSGEGGDDLW